MCLLLLLLGLPPALAAALPPSAAAAALAHFQSRGVRHVTYLPCGARAETKKVVKELISGGVRAAAPAQGRGLPAPPGGVLLQLPCRRAAAVLAQASRSGLFDALHFWFIINYSENGTTTESEAKRFFLQLNLSISSDVVVANVQGDRCELVDVFSYGKIQGSGLEWIPSGTCGRRNGTNISSEKFKYYDRWNFHNLTLRAVSVILERPKVFRAEMLTEPGYTAGVSAMTKVVAQLLSVLMEKHNFRFNYTIVGRWIGSPERNSTLAVTNSLYWGEQDISCTCARIFPDWLDWVDIIFPSATTIETKFYYLIPERGGGGASWSRLARPLSSGAWGCACAAGLAAACALAAAAALERRPQPRLYALLSVLAAACQQQYEDGVQMLQQTFSSQGRRLVLLVVGLAGMLLYNFYTSSVVSWLLNAAAPTLRDLDALLDSDLELVFEDIGYTRGWLDNPGFFYYSGYKNPKEDELRNRKVITAKRTVPLLRPVDAGMELVRTGGYAYHTEPYTAYRAISKTFDETELCKLGALQMMRPARVYIMAQKRSPYKEFFVWSMMRLQERGHAAAARRRAGGPAPACTGRAPRALALPHAAPAFALLAAAALLAMLILFIEIIWHRNTTQTAVRNRNQRRYRRDIKILRRRKTLHNRIINI